jgi:hypothetical protein
VKGEPFLYSGSRLYPNLKLEWRDWSLAELMSWSGVQPEAEGVKKAEYVTRLCGWVNRLEEIRERLRCSMCNETLRPNMEYAKNLARYNVTVASCPRGHDQGVYFNHCWHCKRIIDSRESRERVEGYYVCCWCGSGPPPGAVPAISND